MNLFRRTPKRFVAEYAHNFPSLRPSWVTDTLTGQDWSRSEDGTTYVTNGYCISWGEAKRLARRMNRDARKGTEPS